MTFTFKNVLRPTLCQKVLILCLLTFCFANAAKQSLAVMPCIGNFEPEGLERLRDKLEEVARDVLPFNDFRLIPYKDVREEIGDEELFYACEEQGACFGRLTTQVNADYGAWCKVNSYNGKLKLKFELYSVADKDLIYTREYEAYNPKNVDDLINIMKKEVPIAIRERIPGVVKADDPDKAKPYDKTDTRVNTDPVKTSFWVGIGLDVLGAAFIYAGYAKNDDMLKEHDKYNVSGQTLEYYEDAQKKVEDKRSTRNAFYAVGGLLLASGIGVHIWF